ncbi:hypothetical protein J0S82_007275 [Galemys pyrenaicus]|uniref:Uncharacterized protein n=1 Tax=Galemys pyrenaicus TaxID=202257 RepID=A0A8J6A8N5_GALPY|nr:hypothetical protein J0S82_007275 [Galemys pyrenaicus]
MEAANVISPGGVPGQGSKMHSKLKPLQALPHCRFLHATTSGITRIVRVGKRIRDQRVHPKAGPRVPTLLQNSNTPVQGEVMACADKQMEENKVDQGDRICIEIVGSDSTGAFLTKAMKNI